MWRVWGSKSILGIELLVLGAEDPIVARWGHVAATLRGRCPIESGVLVPSDLGWTSHGLHALDLDAVVVNTSILSQLQWNLITNHVPVTGRVAPLL